MYVKPNHRRKWGTIIFAKALLFIATAMPVSASVCTLADHIVSANTNTAVGFCPAGASHDVITITEDITLTEALPPITGTITIEGGGHTISGAGQFRIFDVQDGGRLTIRQLTLINGNGGRLYGGAVRLGQGDTQLLVEDSTFRNNTARFGGAIGARRQSRFGAAREARSQNSVTIRNSSFQNNSAESGGAITLAAGESTVESSSFRQNLARFSGGAIQIYSGAVAISNSTLFSNVAGAGGAVYVSGGDVALSHLTMLDNAASGPEGAGLRRENRSGRLNLYNSIIAGGSAASLCSARIDQNAGNLIEDWSCNPEFGGDPMLDLVESAELTFAPRDGSPAINTGYQTFCLPRDQIGRARPHGGGCDIGAIESTSASPFAGVCTLYERILAANSKRAVGPCPAGTSHDIITISEDITLGLPLPPITGAITIEGGGHTISGDGKIRIFVVNGGNLTVNNLTLKDGKTEDGGGAIDVRNGGWLTVNGSAFIGNSAGLSGGAIDLYGLTRVESKDPNTSDRIYYSRASGLTVNNSSFINNRSGELGGALNITGATRISNSSFSDNAAGFSGGAIAGNDAYDDSADISNSTFSRNRANWNGGAIESAVVSAIRPESSESEPVDAAQEEKADLDCRVTTTHDLNLRDDPSLNGNRVGRVRQGETLQAIERSASWLRVNYRGAEGWISAYYVDAQGDCGFPPQPQSRTSAQATGSQSDNCCNAGWNCADDRDWANGQWAFANNYCEQRPTHDGRRDDAPSCCHHGWYCAFDFDWTLGRRQVSNLGVEACGTPVQETLEGVIIEGPPWWIKQIREALALLKTNAPEWYAYTIAGPLKIRYWQELASTALGQSINLGSIFDYEDLGFTAAMIVHETCHVQRWLHHVWRDNELETQAEEPVCDTVALNVLDQIAPGTEYIRYRIDEFLELGLDFTLIWMLPQIENGSGRS